LRNEYFDIHTRAVHEVCGLATVQSSGSPYYSELELCGGTMTVSFSNMVNP